MTRLLIIGYVWPEPDSSAAGSRMMQLIALFLQQHWQITFASPAADSEYMIDLASLGIEKVNIEVNNSEFDQFLQECQPDIVVFDRFMMEEQFAWRVSNVCPGAMKVLESSDLHSLRYARQQAYKDNRPAGLQDYHSDVAKREIASILRCDMTLVISTWEVEHLKNIYRIDATLLHYIPFILDTEQTKKTAALLPPFSQREHYIFIGNFFHEPNWDAVLHLKNNIWPALQKKLKGVCLNIYGAYTPAKARQLHNPAQGFHIMGRAESVEKVMSESRVCLAPLQFGAGIKGKLLDAMRCGTPSVTTTIGAEAMCGEMPWNGFVEDDNDRFIEAAVTLYQQESVWWQSQKNGFDIIDEHYNKEKFAPVLIEKMLMVKNHLEQHRLNNFTGAMLSHHSMKSTQYMSRWIEAKNKLKQ